MPAPEAPFVRLMRGFTVNPDSGCWLWGGQTYPNGYGAIKCFGSMVLAHRLSYELHKGPIPSGMEILHSCDVKRCINPKHLRAGTHAENMAEAAARGRIPRGAGHPRFGLKNPRPNQANPVRVLGREYESQKSAERSLGLGNGTVRYWLKSHPEKAQTIGRVSDVVGQ